MQKPVVIVFSSHVVRGAVGGRGSVFALERMGFPVWSVPTVLLPWHPGHGRATRVDMGGREFAALIGDLRAAPRLAEIGGVLTGYFGDAGQVEAVAALVRSKRADNSALYLCDPVIGDEGGLFRPQDVANAIRDQLLPQADIATPNRHELAWLVAEALADNDALVAAARKLGPREVVVTSAYAPTGEIGTLLVTPDSALLATHRAFPDAPHGTGDLFAALYLGHCLDGVAPAAALERSAAAILLLVELATENGADELPLAEGQDAFLAPPRGIAVRDLT